MALSAGVRGACVTKIGNNVLQRSVIPSTVNSFILKGGINERLESMGAGMVDNE